MNVGFLGTNYTYATTAIDFTRSPARDITTYLVPAVIFVVISYLGFYLDPDAQPARVALGMICLLAVLTNFLGIQRALPPTP